MVGALVVDHRVAVLKEQGSIPAFRWAILSHLPWNMHSNNELCMSLMKSKGSVFDTYGIVNYVKIISTGM